MELGLFTCGYQRYPLEQAFEDAGRFGYDYIELWGGYPHAYVEDLSLTGVREVERLVQKYHIPVKCFTPEHNAYPFNYDRRCFSMGSIHELSGKSHRADCGYGSFEDVVFSRPCRLSDVGTGD